VGFKLAILVVIGTDCIGSCKSNYHAIIAMAAFINKYIMDGEYTNHFSLQKYFFKQNFTGESISLRFS
jgi:uncharacterized protein (DUF1919 family)